MININLKYFNLRQICNSGQLFRMYELGNGDFELYSRDRYLRLHQEGDDVTLLCDASEYEEVWKDYFDLDRDYESIVKSIDPKDAFVTAACEAMSGIRVLRQDVWEMMISFIISQQKRIPDIRRCIEALCKKLGEHHEENFVFGKKEWYGFPSAEKIVAAGMSGLDGLSLGYRQRYIYETAVKYVEEGLTDEAIRSIGYDEAKSNLLQYTGIGEKVANCILLFGACYTDAFPVDVHIRDILYREYYQGEKEENKLTANDCKRLIEQGFGRYQGYKGIIQQWIFAYELLRA